MVEVKARKKVLFGFAGVVAVIVAAAVTVAVVLTSKDSDKDSITSPKGILELLDESPIIDGHNDFPYNLRLLANNDLRRVNVSSDLREVEGWKGNPGSHTDLPRLKQGRVGGQFWVAYVPCSAQYKDVVMQTFEQIDVIKRLVRAYSDDLHYAESVADIEEAQKQKKIASMIAVEGGHSMEFSLGVLRSLYEAGARYMTLTHNCNTPWADAAPVDAVNATLMPQSDGLSGFGLKVVEEMNRLGMIIDLSHVSQETMRKALNHSVAPLIFSHSGAHAICNHHRNVPDDVLRLVKEKNGLVMVNFYTRFIKCGGGNATLMDVVDHIEHIRDIAGPDHVGIGGDYDGVDEVPEGLEDVSKYPDLFLALANRNWMESDLKKLARENLIRVFKGVEETRDRLQNIENMEPHQDRLTNQDLEYYGVNRGCISATFENEQAGGKTVEELR